MATEMLARLPIDQLGGAYVFRPFMANGVMRQRGDVLTTAELKGFAMSNLRSLMEQRFIVAWPKQSSADAAVVSEGETFIVASATPNRFDVIVGRKVNEAPLSKSDAEKLAGRQRKSDA